MNPRAQSMRVEGYSQTEDARLAFTLCSARHAQKYWAQVPVKQRLRVIRKFRGLLAGRVPQMVAAVASSRETPEAEILVSEILPLLDAARYLERHAEKILGPQRMYGRQAPIWLGRIDLEVRREPFGVVLVVGPGNYPLFLAAVQVLQALAAGNAVVLKPGRKARPALRVFRALLVQAGLDANLVTLLGEGEEDVRRCMRAGVDKVVLTGSTDTGQAVLETATQTLTPVAAELSGADAVFVLPDADVQLAARAIVFGLKLNQSRTCMRPHRVFAHESVRSRFTYELRREMAGIHVRVDEATSRRATRLVAEAVRGRARVLNETTVNAGLPEAVQFPVLLENVPAFVEIASADIFAPILLLESFTQLGQATESYDRCPYALGASVFGPEQAARRLAGKLNAGFVVINDVIVPTADPRLPFAGRGYSGFGVTRGAEGLLELTQVKAISTRRSGYQHLKPAQPEDGALFAAFIEVMHGATLNTRWQGIKKLLSVGRHRNRVPNGSNNKKVGGC